MKLITNEQQDQLLAKGAPSSTLFGPGSPLIPRPSSNSIPPTGSPSGCSPSSIPTAAIAPTACATSVAVAPHSAMYSSMTWKSLRAPTTVASSATFTSSPRSPVRLRSGGAHERSHHRLSSPSGRRPPGRRSYFGNDVYPRGFCGGNARNVHFLFPHFEQRIRFATFSNRASQPHNRANARGSAVRSCPHPAHLSTNVY